MIPQCPDDDQIAALVEGKLAPAASAQIRQHLDGCTSCQDLVAFALRAAESISTAPPAAITVERTGGAQIGRYQIVERLGGGAMGVVYRAIDPKLDRHVALKLVRDPTPESRTRLEQEAQLAAKLQHPNVVTIYDAGAIDDEDMFVAMELVDGVTLAEWLRTPHELRDTLDVFGQAARGLAAAHAAGLVHRDFKPTNVLVGKDGRVRVADFGLARRVSERPEFSAGTPGSVVGSPAYMSPEQHRGQIADARSDQFAFCVALYEAVYRTRPFRGDSIEHLAAEVIAGNIAPPPRGAPTWLRDAIRRGLSAHRDLRFASMEELAATLDPRRRWRKHALLALALAALAITGGLAYRAHHRTAACRAAVLFDDASASEVQRAFAATGVSYASTSAEHTIAVLRHVATDLASRSEAACLADEPARLADARHACLAARAAALTSLVHTFEHADGAVVQRAVEDAWSTDETGLCSDDAALLASSQSAHALTPDENDKLGTAQGLLQSGHAKEGIALVEPVFFAAKARGDRAAEVAAAIRLAQLYSLDGRGEAAVPLLHEAVELAEAQGFDDDALSAYSLLAGNLDPKADTATRRRYIALARAKLERTKRAGGALDAKLLLVEAKIDANAFDYAGAVQLVRRAIELSTKEYGADHPSVGIALSTLAASLRAQNHFAEELDAATRATALLERALGPDHPDVAGAKMNLVGALIDNDKLADARALLLDADQVFTRALGADHPVHGRVLINLADIDKSMQHWDAALDDSHRALAIVERTAGAESVDAGDVHFYIAETLAGAQRWAESLAEATRSIALLEAALGKDHGHLVNPLLLSAEVEMESGHAPAAVPLAERALGLLAGQSETELADARMVLARALWDGGGDRDRSLALAHQVRDTQGDLGRITRDQIDAWLAEHKR